LARAAEFTLADADGEDWKRFPSMTLQAITFGATKEVRGPLTIEVITFT
jgi:hypothetical protein